MLSRAAVQSARAPLGAIASTSRATATLTSPAPAPSSQPSHARPFSSSAPAEESKARRKTRLVRKANLEKKVQLVRHNDQARPDPVHGYRKGNDDLWNKSLLNRILLRRDDVWGDVVQVDGNSSSPSSSSSAVVNEQGQSSSGGSSSGDGTPTRYTPKLFNFGLDAATAEQLSSVLPATSALRATLGDGDGGAPSSVDAVVLERFERATDAEERKRDALMRIVDLRNADSKGIEVENTRRIAATFGRTPGDTASPEVQAAILTMRIRSLSSHLVSSPRDVQNRQALRLLVARRAKVLKYLRAVSVARYEECLEQIGVEPRAVEGEVVVSKQELRTMIRGA
ncbi:hypothetical protein JCM3775_002715 [Rhodotorula graminis]